MKYLLLLALAGYVWYAWRKQRDAGRGPGAGASASPGRTSPGPLAMVPCARCGLHLPQSEALTDGRGRHFCCAQHREQGSA